MKDADHEGINIHSTTSLSSRVLYFVVKGGVLSCSQKKRVLGTPWYKVKAPVEGWACGELKTDRVHVLLADQEEVRRSLGARRGAGNGRITGLTTRSEATSIKNT